MAQVLVRNLDKQAVSEWKARARRNRRSLQAEIKELIERNAPAKSRAEFLAWAKHMCETTPILTPDSAELIREDRDR